ncbi:probable G-protein coupled receptor No9 [Exaiptasia diaphana]|uniref:G-protein coupled receptors family 1 profile domain-containing protein n=1 Tax=Exaiptasia diaphana TaxID=2652724 RepID=A0A913XU42_EXADI|nr:probable G-protein coupled receptor No9 [Exaiptasia diaphana]
MEVGLTIASVLVTTTNAGVIFMVLCIKELRTYTNIFVVSLAISDTLTGAIFFPLYIFPHSIVTGYLIFFILIAGVMNLCAVTWERYVAIIEPFRYKGKLKKSQKKILIAIWSIPSLVTLIPLAWEADSKTTYHKYFNVSTLLILVIIPYVFIVAAYIRIWLRLRSHTAQMRKRINMTNEQREGARRASLEGKTVKVFFVVVSVFLVSWLPVIYMTIVGVVLNRPDLIPPLLSEISLFTIAGSSMINPILYALMKNDFKGRLSGFFSFIHRQQTPTTE